MSQSESYLSVSLFKFITMEVSFRPSLVPDLSQVDKDCSVIGLTIWGLLRHCSEEVSKLTKVLLVMLSSVGLENSFGHFSRSSSRAPAERAPSCCAKRKLDLVFLSKEESLFVFFCWEKKMLIVDETFLHSFEDVKSSPLSSLSSSSFLLLLEYLNSKSSKKVKNKKKRLRCVPAFFAFLLVLFFSFMLRRRYLFANKENVF